MGVIPVTGTRAERCTADVLFCTKCGAIFGLAKLKKHKDNPVPDDVFTT
jgi:hypothetical protein